MQFWVLMAVCICITEKVKPATVMIYWSCYVYAHQQCNQLNEKKLSKYFFVTILFCLVGNWNLKTYQSYDNHKLILRLKAHVAFLDNSKFSKQFFLTKLHNILQQSVLQWLTYAYSIFNFLYEQLFQIVNLSLIHVNSTGLYRVDNEWMRDYNWWLHSSL